MSSRIGLATQLVQDGEFNIATQMLQKESTDIDALKMLSLLYRYNDEYDQEKSVIDQALSIDQSHAYMRERAAWHALPIVDRVVPRQPLHLPRDPKMIPQAQVLENTCFVTGADSNYFQWMKECIESIRATRIYKDLPVCVLDLGLTDNEKHVLTRDLQVHQIVQPDWDIELPSNVPSGYKAMTARPFLDKYFPNFTYHVWLDADAWVQDERAFDELLTLANQQGIGLTPDLACQKFGSLYNWNFLQPEYRKEEWRQRSTVCSGLLALKSGSLPVVAWQRYMKEHGNPANFYFMIDQLTLNLVYLNHTLQVADYQKTHFFPHPSIGCPYIDQDKIIYNFNKKIVGVIALADYVRKISPYHRPFMDLQAECSQEQLCAIEGELTQGKVTLMPGLRLESVGYRVLPWADKVDILNELTMTRIVD